MTGVDLTFLILFLILVAVIVLVYFMNPILNRKKYKKDREELAERERIYNENKVN